MTDELDNHLSESECLDIIKATESDNLLVVGGQSIFIWAEMYSSKNEWLANNIPTSGDIDFMKNDTATINLASHYQVPIVKPKGDDNTVSDARVNVPINGRHVIVDFMRSVYGVPEKELEKRAVVLDLGVSAGGGKTVSFRIMHPFDCVVSRLSNMNGPIRRVNAHSKTQTEASMHIFKCHLDSLIEDGKQNEACKYLQAFEYVIKNNHIGKNSHRLFGKTVTPIALLESFRDDERLHPMWREKTLRPIIDRLIEARDKKIERDLASGQKFPGYKSNGDVAPEAPKPKM
jgi:hypothetical protein